jgi:hypothetical protein
MIILAVSVPGSFAGTSRSRRHARFIPAHAGVGRTLPTSPQSSRRAPRQRPAHLQQPSALSDLHKTTLCQRRCPAKSPSTANPSPLPAGSFFGGFPTPALLPRQLLSPGRHPKPFPIAVAPAVQTPKFRPWGKSQSRLSSETHQRGGSAKSRVIDGADWANYRADDMLVCQQAALRRNGKKNRSQTPGSTRDKRRNSSRAAARPRNLSAITFGSEALGLSWNLMSGHGAAFCFCIGWNCWPPPSL